jgi:hypothetical protein
MNLVPNTNSKTFTLSAIIIGYILIDDLTPAEQNSLGNWFMLIGQVLSTNSAQQQVINNKTNQSNSTNQHIINSNSNQTSNQNNNEIEMMQKVIKAMQQEINNLKAKK